LPAATIPSAMSDVTTALAPITQLSPTVVPGPMNAWAATQTPLPIMIGGLRKGRFETV
jgi:hypothetical protein